MPNSLSSDREAVFSGAQILVEKLVMAGVTHVFCVTGAGNLAIVDALSLESRISMVYSHHEQAAVMEAQGFARVSGKMGVALVTTGGGAANTLTGVLSAHLDSIPILIISGNESTFHCNNDAGLRAYGIQGFDSVSSLKPVTKMSKRIMEFSEIQNSVDEAIEISMTARMGPVHIDFPMDLQRKMELTQVKAHRFHPDKMTSNQPKRIEIFVEEVLLELLKADKPLIYIGNGCRDEKNLTLLKQFISRYKIPYLLSWSAIDLFPENDPLNIGRVGIYGDRASNILIQQCDLLLSLGTRLAIPQIGYNKGDFARRASKWIVEIDLAECNKFENLGWNILNSDVGIFLTGILNHRSWISPKPLELSSWLSDINKTWENFPRLGQVGQIDDAQSGFVHSAIVIDELNGLLEPDAIVATDVGAALLSGHNIFEKRGDQRFFTSQGLGEMGFGLPAAIGAYFAEPTRQIVCWNTDGAIMFNLQELQVVRHHNIPLKLFIFNNSGYSMIKISQDNLFGFRIEGSSPDTGVSFPNFGEVASMFGMHHVTLNSSSNLTDKIEKGLKSSKATLFEVVMNPAQKYLPRLATTKLLDGTLVSPPLEDLDPKISIADLEEYLGYRPTEDSIRSREL